MSGRYAYLSLLERTLDAVQKEVCCRTENTVVAAGAGSGKTQTLATRFAWLVMSKDIPAEEILTLTFTNKAAAEMYSRIYETLKYFAAHPDVPEKEKKNAMQAAASFAGAHIQTLDSYCAALVRKAAARYGIRPDFSAGSSDSSRSIKDAAFPFILKRRNDPAVQFFAEAGKLQDFAENHFAKIIERCSSLADDEGIFVSFLAVQKKIIAESWNAGISALHSLVRDLSASIEESRAEGNDPYFDALTALLSDMPETFRITEPDDIENDPRIADGAASLSRWAEQVAALKTGRSGRLPKLLQETAFAHKALGAFIAAELLPLAAFIGSYAHTKRFFALLDEFKTEVDGKKRRTGKLTFRDVSELALKILCEQKDIRAEEKQAYSKIMIDEFQDNNAKNRDLLFLLSERADVLTDIPPLTQQPDAIRQTLKDKLVQDKLFFVGDEKQSIYKFRGADVSVFNELTDDLRVPALKMVYNYRSAPELLSAFNLLFGGFGADGSERNPAVFDAEPEDTFEAAYPLSSCAKKLDAKTHAECAPAVLNADSAPIHVCLVNQNVLDAEKKRGASDAAEYLDSVNQQAYFIAEKIRSLYDALPEDKKSYASFAILDFRRTHRATLTNWLNRFGIPYTVDVQKGVFSEAIVNDTYAFIRLCVYPSDAAAFAAVLRAPFTGMSINGTLAALAVFENALPFAEDKTDALREALAADDFEKYLRAASYYAENKHLVLSRPLTVTVEALWYDTGYRYETLANPAVDLLGEQFDLLFELARECDAAGKSPAWFVDQLAALREEEKRALAEQSDISAGDIEYPIEKGDAAQVMTIHKSKGLQFAHVFILGCFQKPRAGGQQSAFFFDEATGVSLKPRNGAEDYFYLRQKERAERKNRAEFKRILYVAVTRAEQSVYIVGEAKKHSTIESKSLLENITDFYYPDVLTSDEEIPAVSFEGCKPFDITFMPLQKVTVLYNRENARAAESCFDAAEKERVYAAAGTVECVPSAERRINPSSLESYQHPSNDAPMHLKSDAGAAASGLSPADFGTLVHDCLYKWACGSPIESYEPPAELLKGIEAAKGNAAAAECIRLCTVFAESETGRAFLAAKNAGRFYRAEWGFKNSGGGGAIISGSMDLVFENADQTYTIIDYKTDAAFEPERHYAQLACYKRAAADLLHVPQERIRTVLYFLRHAQTAEGSLEPQ